MVAVILTLVVIMLFIVVRYYMIKKTLARENSDEDNFLENLTGMPIRFHYKDLEVATDNFSLKLG